MNCNKKELLLYAVTDRSWLNGRTLYDQVEEALKGGATFIQLREKNLDTDSFLKEAADIKELCARYHVPFVINDNVEIAKEINADGVHVGQEDMLLVMPEPSSVLTKSSAFLRIQLKRLFLLKKMAQIIWE